jgi:hypothetical protein
VLAATVGHVQVRQTVNVVIEHEAGADASGNLLVHVQFGPPG